MIKLTEKAIAKIQSQLKNKDYVGIRLSIKPYGCTSLAYIMDFENKIYETDSVVNIDNIKLIINDTSIVFFDDITIDYEINGLNEGFTFNNPKEKARCGCGKSFSI
jgi:iron-sulfur cluster assembly protein